MATSVPAVLGDIVEQAREVRERYPALYAFFATRERCLDRALASIPQRDDIEGWLLFDARQLIRQYLFNIPPGICELARIADLSAED